MERMRAFKRVKERFHASQGPTISQSYAAIGIPSTIIGIKAVSNVADKIASNEGIPFTSAYIAGSFIFTALFCAAGYLKQPVVQTQTTQEQQSISSAETVTNDSNPHIVQKHTA